MVSCKVSITLCLAWSDARKVEGADTALHRLEAEPIPLALLSVPVRELLALRVSQYAFLIRFFYDVKPVAYVGHRQA